VAIASGELANLTDTRILLNFMHSRPKTFVPPGTQAEPTGKTVRQGQWQRNQANT
jgi:hypothetical protein